LTKLGIVGGKLQGMEATYLAKKARIETMVLDRDGSAPALSIADEVSVTDVVHDRAKARKILADCDAVLPANENLETLTVLTEMFRTMDVPLIFDMNAYSISSSKTKSNEFMRKLGIPLPRGWPECGFPVVVKPSGESGSVGVTKATNSDELVAGMNRVRGMNDEAVVQEFLDGPSISVEVIADGEDAVPLVTTEIFLDSEYDCKMVGSPWEDGAEEVVKIVSDAGRRMAMELELHGIMDVEAIVSGGTPRILEIDARIPSQTPTAVLHSHGINMIGMLTEMVVNDRLLAPPEKKVRMAYYEHVAVEGRIMRSCGEGSFAEVRNPRIVRGLFGSDEMITDYEPEKESWRATIINTGATAHAAKTKREKVLRAIMSSEGIEGYVDSTPKGSS
jgi:pyrrolysine biosynthesis protein PylC